MHMHYCILTTRLLEENENTPLTSSFFVIMMVEVTFSPRVTPPVGLDSVTVNDYNNNKNIN